MRAKDLQLTTLQKYGISEKSEQNLNSLIFQYGEAAAKIDLLEIKHTKPIIIKMNGTSTKGAAFILYNSARIETLLRKFEDNVEKGIYPQLPNIDNIDFALLNEEEEWKLVFNYILLFPNIISRCVEGLDVGKCAPHLLLQFIFSLVNTFSVYYRRKRILLDGRNHLIPLVHARICLIKCIRTILNRTLAIIDIDPIQHM